MNFLQISRYCSQFMKISTLQWPTMALSLSSRAVGRRWRSMRFFQQIGFLSSLPQIFSAEIAQKLCQGTPPSALGKPYASHLYISDTIPKVRSHRIEGSVIYIDHFGNVVSNITKELLLSEAKGRALHVYFRYKSVENFRVEDICTQYNQIENSQIPEGTPFLVFNHLDYLEMSIYKANPDTVGGQCQPNGYS